MRRLPIVLTLMALLPLHTKAAPGTDPLDRKSTRLNSSHRCISYAVFCLKKKKVIETPPSDPLDIHTVVAPCQPELIRQALELDLFFFLKMRRPPKFSLFPYTPALPI